MSGNHDIDVRLSDLGRHTIPSPGRISLGQVGQDSKLITLTGYVGKFGRKDSTKERTILIRRLIHEYKVVADHQWFICGEWSRELRRWDMVRIISTGVSMYKRGYRHRNMRVEGGKTYQLNSPTSASLVKPPLGTDDIIRTIDDTMIEYDMFDHGTVFNVLTKRGDLLSDFSRRLFNRLPQLSDDKANTIVRYMANRLLQYGSMTVTARAIVRLSNRAKMERRKSAAHSHDVGQGGMQGEQGRGGRGH